MKTKRIFTSIDLPDHVKEGIKAIHNTKIYPIKWMELRNLHITLNFLGELSDEKIELAKEIITEVTSEFSAFDLNLDHLVSKRHMLWLVPENNKQIMDLKYDLSYKLKKKRIEKRERERYSPHVMVARQKNVRRKMRFEEKKFKPLQFRVESISMYQSELTPGIATHTLIQKFPLA